MLSRILLAACALTAEQRAFWRDFYRDAFAEFAVLNGLAADDVEVEVEAEAGEALHPPLVGAPNRKRRALLGLGGGQWGNQPFNVASMCAHTIRFDDDSSTGVERGPAAPVASQNERIRSRYKR